MSATALRQKMSMCITQSTDQVTIAIENVPVLHLAEGPGNSSACAIMAVNFLRSGVPAVQAIIYDSATSKVRFEERVEAARASFLLQFEALQRPHEEFELSVKTNGTTISDQRGVYIEVAAVFTFTRTFKVPEPEDYGVFVSDSLPAELPLPPSRRKIKQRRKRS